MLTFTDGKFTEQQSQNAMVLTGGGAGSIYNNHTSGGGGLTYGMGGGVGNTIHFDTGWVNYPIYWQSYPVYVCSDKTKKAIEVLKALQSEKIVKCESVPRFIELVEKISGLL